MKKQIKQITHETIIAYIKKLVKIRKHLIATGKSKIDEVHAVPCCQHLDLMVNAYPYATIEKAAGLFLRKADFIYYLMPQNSKCTEKLMLEFNEIKSFCMSLKWSGKLDEAGINYAEDYHIPKNLSC
jgi:hypothetical protein